MHGTYGEVLETHVKVHRYIVININISDKLKVKINMVYYIGNMIDECTKNITQTSQAPAYEDLFADGKFYPPPKYKSVELYTIISKVLFTYKRARTDIHTTIAALCTHL